MSKIKTCKKHGAVKHTKRTDGYYRCSKCASEQVTKNRRNRKKKLVEHFGGCCKICGYDRCNEALQFHHIDPETKEFGISESGLCRSWDRMLTEAKKCVLICSNCHAEVEHGITRLGSSVAVASDC